MSRRDFLRLFPGLMSRKADEIKKSIPGQIRRRKKVVKPVGDPALPADGEVVDGLPLLYPWIGTAWAVATARGRPRSLPFLLGATGEAFSLFYSLEDPAGAHALSPGNTFLLALALAGLGGRAATGGPLDPAIGGVKVSLERGLTTVLATADGPAVILAVNRENRTAEWVRPGEPRAEISFESLEAKWAEGTWPGGRGRFLRCTVESGPDRPRAAVLPAALPAAVSLLLRETAGDFASGPAAWAALAGDIESGTVPAEVLGRLLPRVAVARRAAGDFLAEVEPLVAADRRPAVAEATRTFREIHAPSIAGEIFGTGLLPEVAECLFTAGAPDPEKLADPALRKRAAALLLEIRERELDAARRLEP